MTTRDGGDTFHLAVTQRPDVAEVSVRGELDVTTAPVLSSVLGLLVSRGHPNVVLDIGGLGFVDASGVGVVAKAAALTAAEGGVLTVRSPSTLARRILAITEVGGLVRLESSSAASLGAEQRHDDAPEAATQRLSADLAHVGSTPAGNAVIDAALRSVTALALATIEGADGVSVSLERHGRMTTVAATDETVLRMDGHQYETGEGPCLSAAGEGRWFHAESLDEEERWPVFVPRARAEGIASVLSSPLLGIDRPVGALNIYSNTDRAFEPRQQELAALFATQATAILVDAGRDVSDAEIAERIDVALTARAVIARAQGALMATEGLSADDADARLHRSARAAECSVLQHATVTLDALRPTLVEGQEPLP